MKITIGAGLPAKGDVQINSCQLRYLLRCQLFLYHEKPCKHHSLLYIFTSGKHLQLSTTSYPPLHMAKLKLLFTALILLTICLSGTGQEYRVHYIRTDGDSSTHALHEWLQTIFSGRDEAGLYLVQIPSLLHTRGFIAASVDHSVLDSSSARVSVYLGPQYKWTRIQTRPQDAPLLTAIRWPKEKLNAAPDYDLLHNWQQKILDHLEETGYLRGGFRGQHPEE